MSEIRCILLCSGRFAIPAMQELSFFKQLVVVAVPETHTEMVENVQAVLKGLAIPLLVLRKKDYVQQLADAIGKYQVNTGLMMTFSYRIPASIFNLPEKGFYNVHPGPLPSYRGADPIFHQIKNREKRAAVTIHKLDEGFDTGEVVMQEMISLDPADTWGMLNSKLSFAAARQVRVLSKFLTMDISVPSRPQDESKAVYYKKQAAADVVINWHTMDADEIIALIHACNPWNKGALTQLNNKFVRLLEAEKGTEPMGFAPGTITSIDEKFLSIATVSQVIKVRIVCIDDGFLAASRLTGLGIVPGLQFQNI